jgi:ribosome-associated toxin RatA of RatAB toxin-antitoxin module
MAESTSASRDIEASPAEVMAVIADFPSYPQWASGIVSAEVLESGPAGRASRVRFRLESGPVKDDYVLAYDWEGDSGVTWQLEQSRTQRSQRGSYRLEPAGGSTRVTYQLSVELTVPLPGMLKRRAEARIVSTALDGLAKRVSAARG